jgi:5'-nucleotidase
MIACFRRGRVAAVSALLGLCLAACSSSDGNSEPLRILVSNDDGVAAEGIDALVRGLLANPNNVLVVSAPLENASGAGDQMIGDEIGQDCIEGTGMAMPASTASGYETDVWAVDGCPVDAVLYGLENLYPDEPPHVVITGLNEGQNVGLVGERGLVSQISGTVGGAKAGACSGVPAVASSQGDPENPSDPEAYDYESGVAAVVEWLEANRSALLTGEVSVENITSINIPTCAEGTEIRGTAEVPLGTQLPEGVTSPLATQDCASDLEDPQDDLEAFFFGFVAVTPVPSNSSDTCDKIR